ncbi:hypothetical protein BV22DRAFT_37894 [Leucogyrophana mollusca]|uniref:Uncharacterized protein n=1 Tax=Leucogyrophana mollusca TaxID=85980 RepID=A0ACB8BYS5_9AGAM|nr:hypothetical protein BV22DRAFT_37894 [Leucogyrophana mollusca]
MHLPLDTFIHARSQSSRREPRQPNAHCKQTETKCRLAAAAAATSTVKIHNDDNREPQPDIISSAFQYTHPKILTTTSSRHATTTRLEYTITTETPPVDTEDDPSAHPRQSLDAGLYQRQRPHRSSPYAPSATNTVPPPERHQQPYTPHPLRVSVPSRRRAGSIDPNDTLRGRCDNQPTYT